MKVLFSYICLTRRSSFSTTSNNLHQKLDFCQVDGISDPLAKNVHIENI
jgi:hypothetical protein